MVSYGEVVRIDTHVHVTAFYCASCYGGYVAEVDCSISPSAHGYKGNFDNNSNYKIRLEYPLPAELGEPEFLPDNISRFFSQAASSLKEGNLDASAMMSRKVLEVGVKTLSPEASGTLYSRIERLAEDGQITEDLNDWAHIIRDSGNEATHEEEPVTREFAEELLSFVEMFLRYTFTMPKMVEERRSDDGEQ